MVSSVTIYAQSYRFSPYPDLWYNDVDGIRLGLRFLGEVEGTFKDGPHRLDAGAWIGSKLPGNPFSYYITLTEPIKSISEYGSEGNIQLYSSIRTGYTKHQIQFNKRWQQSFEDLNYFETSFSISTERLFNLDYAVFPMSWSTELNNLLKSSNRFSRSINNFRTNTELTYSFELDQKFDVIQFESINRYRISDLSKLRIRFFYRTTDENARTEFMSYLWTNAPIEWVQSGLKRGEGTIPGALIDQSFIQFSGGPNLRGYIEHQIENKFNDDWALFATVYSLNFEYVFANPIDKSINKNNLIGDIVTFESYLFIDIGGALNETAITNKISIPNVNIIDETGLLMDSGLGFQLSVNIPDYLGKDRGIFIRYDIPFWVSSPSNNESNFKYRNVVGIGAIFNF